MVDAPSLIAENLVHVIDDAVRQGLGGARRLRAGLQQGHGGRTAYRRVHHRRRPVAHPSPDGAATYAILTGGRRGPEPVS
ncbi:hypothetical protein Sgou_32010 [Streptomyces gougerotii]|uniref:Uncharacterized protein n=1 Tax=Streptomyces gougerotii TaxID=53448 RepID=A0A8H9HX47_9ACTN|nr:hypothetical protein Sgou_32010 [Streptomyces gougerotii]GGU91335.1 hypothetical protein GCM10010227_53220 [Streptomyces gougerotii]